MCFAKNKNKYYGNCLFLKTAYSNFSDKMVYSKSVDPDQTALNQ